MTDVGLARLRGDLKRDERVVRVKKRVLRVLSRLPDDAARWRVMRAVAIFLERMP